MADLNVRSDSVDVEQIMKSIRTRIREKRGADYTDAELQRLASVKLEQFADPSGLRSDLLVQFQQKGNEPSTYHRHRGPRRWILMLLHPLLKRIQKQLMSDLNLYFEIIHNLVIEVTRLGIETQNLKMRVESLSSRVEFDERRGKALEQVVQYRSDALPRQDRQERQDRHHEGRQQRQNQQRSESQYQPPPQQAPGTVSYGSIAPTPIAAAAPTPVAGTPVTASPSNGEAAARPSDQSQQGQQGQQGQPGQQGQGQGQLRPDGTRRRRRRRRRRPGNSMAQSPNAGNNGAPGAPFTPNASPTDSQADDDGPDGDDGPDQ
jgi:hypothetical protein